MSRSAGNRWRLCAGLGWLVFGFGPVELPAQPVRAAIPEVAARDEALKWLNETYNLNEPLTSDKREAALKELVKAAPTPGLADNERYVLLSMIVDLSREVGDVDVWQTAVNQLTDAFDFDIPQFQAEQFLKFLQACKSGILFRKLMAEQIEGRVNELVTIRRYPDALAILTEAEATAKRVSAASAIRKQLAEMRGRTLSQEGRWQAFESALGQLREDAGNRQASDVVGRWYALEERDWAKALPFLAESANLPWKTAAELELQSAGEMDLQMAIADAWWDAAKSEPEPFRAILMLHAGQFYEVALPQLTSPSRQQLVTARLKELARLKPQSPIPSPSPTVAEPSAPTKIMPVLKTTESGIWVDLLSLSENFNWTARGYRWDQQATGRPGPKGIQFKSAGYRGYPFPAILDGDYELTVEFTRHSGSSAVVVVLPMGMTNVQFEFSGKATLDHAFWMDGLWDHADVTRSPTLIQNGRRHKARFRVQHDGDDVVFSVDLDQRRNYIFWQGAEHRWFDKTRGPHAPTTWGHAWVGGWDSDVTFHSCRVRMLSGRLIHDAYSDQERQLDRAQGLVRLVYEARLDTRVQTYEATVNQSPRAMINDDPAVAEFWPLVTPEFRPCTDYYGAGAPARLKCPIPKGAKSFSVVGYNERSRAAKFIVEVDGTSVFDSGLAAMAIAKVDLRSENSSLTLVTDPAGPNAWDHTYWCYPRFHAVPVAEITEDMLDADEGPMKFTVSSFSVESGNFTHNLALGGNVHTPPVHFRDVRPCQEFILAHAPSSLIYAIPDGMSRFTAVGYNARSHSVLYEVYADGKQIYVSPQAGVVAIDVKLPAGVKTLGLKTNELGNSSSDHSMWCYPRLHRD